MTQHHEGRSPREAGGGTWSVPSPLPAPCSRSFQKESAPHGNLQPRRGFRMRGAVTLPRGFPDRHPSGRSPGSRVVLLAAPSRSQRGAVAQVPLSSPLTVAGPRPIWDRRGPARPSLFTPAGAPGTSRKGERRSLKAQGPRRGVSVAAPAPLFQLPTLDSRLLYSPSSSNSFLRLSLMQAAACIWRAAFLAS